MTFATTSRAERAASRLIQDLRAGYALISAGNAPLAQERAMQLLRAFPQSAHVLAFASEACLASGDPEGALSHLDDALAASDGDPALKIKKAQLLQQMRRRRAAIALVSEARLQASGDGRVHWQAGTIASGCNDLPLAVTCYRRAHALIGDQPALMYDLAVALFFTGDFDAAESLLDALLAIDPQAGHAVYLRSTLRRQTGARNHVADIEGRIDKGFANPASAAAAGYAMAKELEDLGLHERSFGVLEVAATTKRGTLNLDLASELRAMDAVCAAYSAGAMEGAATQGIGSEAIFIVGMPRTGTTLVERLLIRTGQVASSGELLDFANLLGLMTGELLRRAPGLEPAEASLQIDFQALGREYLRGAREAAAGEAAMFIDKMPVNFMYCGAIRKALPGARIIHLVRDPLDTCYAVYKTLFFSAYKFSYDQAELGDYYAAYHRTMQHWHTAMPGQILDVRYEDLVRDPAGESRRILEWCGLDWSEEVLDASRLDASFATASAAQVREPVHSRSIHSSRRHLSRLSPLAARLQAAGLTIS
jgi:tetratricopeptide (TPR) repeat protein